MSRTEKRASANLDRGILDLPDTVDLAAVNAAEVAVIRLAAQGRIDVREALWFSRMLEHRRRAIADRTLEEKMTRIEELKKAEGNKA